MKAVARNLQNWPLALALLGGVGPAISFLSPIFTISVRWLLVGAVLALMMSKSRALVWIRSAPGLFIAACVAWGVMTTAWSQQPLLSLMKSGAFVLVASALVSAGYRWVQVNPAKEALTFLTPLMVAALLAGVLGKTSSSAYVAGGAGVDLYRGLTGNSNMFGSLMFMILPLILWKAHLGRGRVRAVWSILLVLAASMLILSVARSSILAAVVLAGTYGLSLSLARRGAFLFFGGLGIVATVLMMPGTLDKFETRYVRKNTVVQGSSVMFSRQGPWELSLEMARQGGIIGAGYGVSIGGGTFTGGLTAFGYGREKGNSQLAIVEETGIVGLMLYGLVVVALLGRLSRAFLASRNRDARALVGIVLGAILGELVLGVFEAWWVAPGSPESLWFWTIVGVALGVCDAVLPQPGRRATPVSTNPRMAGSASRR